MTHAEKSGLRFSDEQYIEMMRADAADGGVAPTVSDWRRREDRPSDRSVCRRFGSWNNLVKRAGLEPRLPAHDAWTTGEILRLWRADTEMLGRVPTVDEWEARDDRPGATTLKRRFGDTEALSRVAGVTPRLPGSRKDSVPNAPLRDAFVASGRTATEVAAAVGWIRRRGANGTRGDATRLRRLLGLAALSPSTGSRRSARVQDGLSEGNALKIARALGADPHEVGL